jgi:hypothetical protein
VIGGRFADLRQEVHVVCFAFLLLTPGGATMAQESPANVAGDWTIHPRGLDGGERTQLMRIVQQGGASTGHYHGPGQQGQLEGTVNQQHIPFRTNTHAVLTFRGRVDGPVLTALSKSALSARPIETSMVTGAGMQYVPSEKARLRIRSLR